MARDFLLASKTYREKVPLKIQLRRHIICGELDNLYQLPRGKGAEVAASTAEIVGERLDTSIAYREAKIYRNAFDYLGGSQETRARFRELLNGLNPAHTTAPLFGVWCLVTDEIHSWELLEEVIQERIQEGEAVFQRMLADKKLEQAGRLKEQATSPDTPHPQIPSPIIPQEVLDSITAIRAGYEAFLMRQKELELALAEREQENGTLKIENEYLRLSNKRLRGETERIKEVRLEELIEFFPQATRLYRLVQEMQEKTREEGRYERMLPRITQWNGDEILIEYLPRFREQFRLFPAREQGQIVDAAQRITAAFEASHVPGFDTQKVTKAYPGTPEEFLKSRVSRELRFGWRKEGPVIYFYVVFRKGDKDYVESEA